MAKKLCIDPGHGLGNKAPTVFDPGAISEGVSEADVVLAYALAIKFVALQRGIHVFLTRDEQSDVTPVGSRAGAARQAGCDLFISLHLNSASPSASGTETYYRDAADKKLAEVVQTAVLTALQFKDRRVKNEKQSQHPRLAVLDFSGPACLVELGFVSNANNRQKLLLRSSRLAVAHAILDAVIAAYGPLS
ncbi:MAG: N-acetylmuramoyl-L-alanine amidase [Armatimonadota bacterium]